MNFIKRIIYYSFYFYNIKKLNSKERIFLLFFLFTIPFAFIAFKDKFEILENPDKVFKLICLEEYEKLIFKDTLFKYYKAYKKEFNDYLNDKELTALEFECLTKYPLLEKGVIEYKGEKFNTVYSGHLYNFLRSNKKIINKYDKDIYFLIRFPFLGINPLYYSSKARFERVYYPTYFKPWATGRMPDTSRDDQRYGMPAIVKNYMERRSAILNANETDKLNGFIDYEVSNELKKGLTVPKRYYFDSFDCFNIFKDKTCIGINSSIHKSFFDGHNKLFSKNFFFALHDFNFFNEKKKSNFGLPLVEDNFFSSRFPQMYVIDGYIEAFDEENKDKGSYYLSLTNDGASYPELIDTIFQAFYSHRTPLFFEQFVYTDKMKNYGHMNGYKIGSIKDFRNQHINAEKLIILMSLGSHLWIPMGRYYIEGRDEPIVHPFPKRDPITLYEVYRESYPNLKKDFDSIDNVIRDWDDLNPFTYNNSTFYDKYYTALIKATILPVVILLLYLTILPSIVYRLINIFFIIFKPFWLLVYGFVKRGDKNK